MVKVEMYLFSEEEVAHYFEFNRKVMALRQAAAPPGPDGAAVVTTACALAPETVAAAPVAPAPPADDAPTAEETTDALRGFIAAKGTPDAVALMKSLGAARVSDLDDDGRRKLLAAIAAEVPA